jgi:phosphoadenosine phosphosulfate reductase
MKDLFGNPDVEAIYQAALAVPLEEKVSKAIAMIKEYEPMALQLSNDGYYVAFSGGKDSIVMERLFKMSGVKYKSWYNNVTIDPPELVQFIKRKYPEVRWNNVGKNLPAMMADKSAGPPTRIIRWCCEIYKEQGGNGLFKAIGVRASESPRRKGMWQPITMHRTNNSPIISPILYWTDLDVWGFIAQEEMEYCELYDQGFKRLGCVGCPMSGPTGMARDFKRWPKYEQMWRRGFQAFWDKYKGVPRRDGKPRSIEKFPTVDDLWNWWVSGKAYEGEQADCQMWLW